MMMIDNRSISISRWRNPDCGLTRFFSAKFPTVDPSEKQVSCKVPYLLCRHDSSIPEYRATYDSARLSSLFYCKASSLRLQQEDILTMVQLTLHSKAVNLARRFSVQNEPDMMRAWYLLFLCFFALFLVLQSSSHTKTYRRHLSHTLTEESFVEDDSFDDSPKKYTREFCTELSKHLVSEKALPMECYKFRDVVRDLKRRDTDTTHPTSWMSWD